MNAIQPKLFLKSGRMLQEVTAQQASRAVTLLRRNAMNEGLSPDDVTLPKLHDANGRSIGNVSWNGRVWIGEACVYEPTDADYNFGEPVKEAA